ncbi:MAG TPA: hypothetical protein VFY57_08300, partial [Rubrobacteraceae bacterium]|nr:hypothetical protein [Rubrobacteraceae bacterium]
MRNRLWIAALSVVFGVILALPSQAGGIMGKLKNRGEKKKMQDEQVRSCIQKRAWIAYFRNEENELAPVRDTLNTENDEDWIGLQFTDYEGPRI